MSSSNSKSDKENLESVVSISQTSTGMHMDSQVELQIDINNINANNIELVNDNNSETNTPIELTRAISIDNALALTPQTRKKAPTLYDKTLLIIYGKPATRFFLINSVLFSTIDVVSDILVTISYFSDDDKRTFGGLLQIKTYIH